MSLITLAFLDELDKLAALPSDAELQAEATRIRGISDEAQRDAAIREARAKAHSFDKAVRGGVGERLKRHFSWDKGYGKHYLAGGLGVGAAGLLGYLLSKKMKQKQNSPTPQEDEKSLA